MQLNPHATELIFLTLVPANKMQHIPTKYTTARVFVLRIRVSCALSLNCVWNANQRISKLMNIH